MEKTCRDYIAQVSKVDLKSVSHKLGGELVKDGLIIPVFGKPFKVFENRITDDSGNQPNFDISILL